MPGSTLLMPRTQIRGIVRSTAEDSTDWASCAWASSMPTVAIAGPPVSPDLPPPALGKPAAMREAIIGRGIGGPMVGVKKVKDVGCMV